MSIEIICFALIVVLWGALVWTVADAQYPTNDPL